MTIGALLDLGGDPNVLTTELEKLDLHSEYQLKWERVVKKGVSATKFDVITDSKQDHHQHDGHSHHHDHRHYTDIVKLIEKAQLNENVSRMALAIFEKIGKAEAKIHNMPLEKIHFHEVGAIDSIIDIVGTCILIDKLNISTIVSSAVPVGNGYITIDHGTYPIPAPATLDILRGIPLKKTDIEGELTTPTGAGIVAVLAKEYGPIPSMSIEGIGYGAGTKDLPNQPNVLRVMLGTS
jgi:uncharacterized protein (TIGR00299 family) protein